MPSLRVDHVGVVVDDLDAVKAFFAALGLEPGHAGPERLTDRGSISRV